jgi:hypothetical protein
MRHSRSAGACFLQGPTVILDGALSLCLSHGMHARACSAGLLVPASASESCTQAASVVLVVGHANHDASHCHTQQGRTESRRRCGRGERSPGADVDSERAQSESRRRCGRGVTVPGLGADVAPVSSVLVQSTDVVEVSAVPVRRMWKLKLESARPGVISDSTRRSRMHILSRAQLESLAAPKQSRTSGVFFQWAQNNRAN